MGLYLGVGGPAPGGKSQGDSSWWWGEGGGQWGGWRSCGRREWEGGVDSALTPDGCGGPRWDFLEAAAAEGSRPGLGNGGRVTDPDIEDAPCASEDK